MQKKSIYTLAVLTLVGTAFSFYGFKSGENTATQKSHSKTAIASASPEAETEYSFVTFGCNRVENADTVGNVSTANVYQLKRDFEEIAAMNPLPKFLFVTGDLILGYEKDTIRLAREFRGWINIYKHSSLANKPVRVIAMPGNHESDQKIDGKKTPVAVAERVFVREMHEFIAGNNGPKPNGFGPGKDSVYTDQSQLTYSFDYGKDHYVIINSDPVGQDYRVHWHWIQKDVLAAHKNGARHIFTFAHKPAYTSHFKKGGSGDGLDNYPAARDSFWTALENSKTVAMLVAHNHLWDSIQPHAGKTWLIVAGNGGSKLEKNWTEKPNGYFGYTVVTVPVKGAPRLTSYGRDVDPTNYNNPMPNSPTTIRAQFELK